VEALAPLATAKAPLAELRKAIEKRREMYEEELQKLTTQLRDAEEERAQLEQRWREKYTPDIEELIEFAKGRSHAWAKHWAQTQEAENSAKQMLLSVLYVNTGEQRKIAELDAKIKRLTPRAKEAKEMVRFARGAR
jgi:predicted  nucleic acid-binding Zn-ribbon protein